MEEDEDAPQVEWVARSIYQNEDVVRLIEAAIVDDPPVNLADGGVIKAGFSPELDELRGSSREARAYIAGLESKERERTGIRSLKVGYNRVFGYYIEVSKANAGAVPEEYIRRQTLVGGERYITPEMKEYEAEVLSADERILDLEASLFRRVCGADRRVRRADPRNGGRGREDGRLRVAWPRSRRGRATSGPISTMARRS